MQKQKKTKGKSRVKRRLPTVDYLVFVPCIMLLSDRGLIKTRRDYQLLEAPNHFSLGRRTRTIKDQTKTYSFFPQLKHATGGQNNYEQIGRISYGTAKHCISSSQTKVIVLHGTNINLPNTNKQAPPRL